MRDAPPPRRIQSLAGLGGAVGCLAIDVLYVRLIQQGGVMPGARVPLVVGWLAVSALTAGVGAFTPAPRRRALLLGVAAALMLVLSVPALWSIGGPLFICALATGFGAARSGDELHLAAGPRLLIPLVLIAGAAALLAAGFALPNA